MAFSLRGCTFFVTTVWAAELSVWSGVGGCGCPISISVFLMGTALRAFMYMAPISASAADDMTALIICATVWTAPLLWGNSVSAAMKKCPPALLLAFDSLKYEASLWTASTMSLAW